MMKTDDVIINLKLLKLCGFYQMFDPTCTKIYDWNVYRLLLIVLCSTTQFIFLFGTIGVFIRLKEIYSHFDFFLYSYSFIHIYLSLWKLRIIFYNTDKIWELFDVTKLNFLWSYNKNLNILYESRDNNIKMTNLYIIATTTVIIPWTIYPIVTYTLTNSNDDLRFENILNLWFPITISTYNKYFLIFFMMELLLFVNIVYIMIITEIFFISLCYAIIGQYKTLQEATKIIGDEDEFTIGIHNDYTTDYDNLKTIIFDQQQLHSKIRLFLTSFVWPIVLLYIMCTSSGVIIAAYGFILICTSGELLSFINLWKVSSGMLYCSLLLLLYSYFIGNINEKDKSMNFAIYSCNWTKRDLKFKKLVLLAMRMNDANQIIIRVTQKKIINLQMFASVMTTCYNIISIIAKTINFKNE